MVSGCVAVGCFVPCSGFAPVFSSISNGEFYAQRQDLPTGGSFSEAIAILCMWLCEKNLLLKWHARELGIQIYASFLDDISIKLWVPKDDVDDVVSSQRIRYIVIS